MLTAPHYNIGYIVALLNSKLLSLYHVRRSALALRDDFPKLVLDDTRLLPIRRIDFTTPKAERQQQLERVVRQYQGTLQSAMNDTARSPLTFTELLTVVGKPGENLRIPLDVLHDSLGYLAEEMTELHKTRRQEVKRFLGWVQAALRLRQSKDGDASLEALAGKTVLMDYLGNYQKAEVEQPFEAILEVLRKNAKRLGVSLNDSRLIGRLREEYEKSLAVLLPIKRRLAATDWLIDQLVYRLYGLTEEEIRIVEGVE